MLEVAKVNKRLVIREAATNRLVYVMPNFLSPVRDRAALQKLADRLNADEGIRAIMDFETAHNPRTLASVKEKP